jgi:hypothetical protein
MAIVRAGMSRSVLATNLTHAGALVVAAVADPAAARARQEQRGSEDGRGPPES